VTTQTTTTCSCALATAHENRPILTPTRKFKEQIPRNRYRVIDRRVGVCWTWRTSYSNYGDRCFAAAGPKLWNSLPADLLQADISFQRFKRLLETFLFGAEIAAHCD